MSDAPPSELRQLFGRALGTIGMAMFPLGVGMVLGFYFADQGMRWLPTMLGVLMLTAVLSMLALISGRLMLREAFAITPQGKRVRRRLFLMLAVVIASIGARFVVYWLDDPTPLTALSEDEFNVAFEADAEKYQEYDDGLERLVAQVERHPAIQDDRRDVLSRDQEGELLDLWEAIYDHAFALDQLRMFYEDWYRFDPSRAERSRHLRSFLLTYAAELALYEKSTRLVKALDREPNAIKLLNAPHPQRGLGADSFSQFRQDLQGTRDQARVLAGKDYLELLAQGLRGRQEARELGATWLWDDIEDHLANIETHSPIARAGLTAKGDLELFRRRVRRTWYPAQKEVAEWMGDTRVRRRGWYLITHEQQEAMDPALEPGDILLSRKNWYVSNLGLPGFWPHAILYVGDPEKFDAYYDDPAVRAHVRELSGEDLSLSQYLEREWPTRWLEYTRGDGEDPYRVIEAVSEGVIFNTLHHASGDYLVALRPRLGKLAKAQAVIHAFSELGKPYDFDFDFATDHALVCTELVWRSYRPAAGKEGLEFPLTKVAGRRTLPANEIAKLYSEQADGASQQLDFVYFLDAREGAREAVVSDEAAFRETHRRLKWDIAQK
jgi:hypothetical protein